MWVQGSVIALCWPWGIVIHWGIPCFNKVKSLSSLFSCEHFEAFRIFPWWQSYKVNFLIKQTFQRAPVYFFFNVMDKKELSILIKAMLFWLTWIHKVRSSLSAYILSNSNFPNISFSWVNMDFWVTIKNHTSCNSFESKKKIIYPANCYATDTMLGTKEI